MRLSFRFFRNPDDSVTAQLREFPSVVSQGVSHTDAAANALRALADMVEHGYVVLP